MFWFSFGPETRKRMHETLTFYHNLMRWLVLAALLYAVFRAYRGYTQKRAFTKTDNALRHWTATLAHVQLLLGMVLYFKSPGTRYFWANLKEAMHNRDILFFGIIHGTLMLTAIVVLTIGSALAKRKQAHGEKFSTMLVWFSVALAIILIAVPWPFSPFANRPYFR